MKFRIIHIATILFFLTNFLHSQIINEIMPAPINNAPEWIEIYNNSNTQINDTIILKDATTSYYKIPINLLSNQYCVITKDTAGFKQSYKIPNSAILIQSKIPILNNTDDYLYLFNAKNELLDSLYYKIQKSNYGISIERVSKDIYFQNSNFRFCISKDSNTAGDINSVDKNNKSNSLKVLYDESYNNLNIYVINNSSLNYSNPILKVIFKEAEILKEINKINENDSLFFNISKEEISESFNFLGSIPLSLLLLAQYDTIFQTSINININIPNNTIFFNEVLFDVDALHSEFIELYNNSMQSVNLQNLNIETRSNNNITTYQITNENIINPNDYYLIAGDTNIYKYILKPDSQKVIILSKRYFLNNNSDSILLTDKYYNILDSIYYNANYHNSKLLNTKNRSLERKSLNSPAVSNNNLISSLDEKYSTPLKSNYCLYLPNESTNIKLSKDSFNKEKDQECKLIITNESMISFCRISILDLQGNFIKSIGNINNIGYNYQIDIAQYLYDLFDNAYIIQISITDADSNQFQTYNLLIAVGK